MRKKEGKQRKYCKTTKNVDNQLFELLKTYSNLRSDYS